MTTIPSTPVSEPRPDEADKANAPALPTVAPISPSQLAIVQATVPVLQAHGEAITTTMYRNMIKAHPELNNVFSHTSQTTGAQPRALARAVLAYALYIDDLPQLAHAVERIAQKHASLFVQPAQYDVVGAHLVGAIGEVLGAAATPEMVEAWTAAYGVLAAVFIGREAQLYAADAGWTGWRTFRVARRVREAAGIASFYLEPVAGGEATADTAAAAAVPAAAAADPLPRFLPGQYVSLQVPVPQLGHLQSRQFSLSAWPGPDGRQYRVSVKKEHDDAAHMDGVLTSLLHDRYHEGDTVELSHPHGDFFVDPSDVSKAGAPVVLVSAGVGATPLVAMLQALVQPSAVERPVAWVHTSRARATQPFADEVARAVEGAKGRVVSHVHLRQEAGGASRPRLDIASLDQERLLFARDRRAEYYVCGPEPFMVEVRSKLVALGVDKQRVFLELFATGDVQDA